MHCNIGPAWQTHCNCTKTGCFRPTPPTRGDRAAPVCAKWRDLPIISPHGHTDPHGSPATQPFANATELLLAPDHYLYRMLYSQGVDLDALGVGFAHAALRPPIRARRGACSQSTFTCSAARRRRCG